jgi:hypothetical protein
MKDFHLKRDIFGTVLSAPNRCARSTLRQSGIAQDFLSCENSFPCGPETELSGTLGLNSTESRVQTTNGQPTRRAFGYSLAASATDNANFNKRFRSFYNLSWAEIGELRTPRKVASGKAWRASVVASPRQEIYRSMLFTEVWPT